MGKSNAPNLVQLGSINADGSRRHLTPSDVKGRFITARRVTFAVLIAVYVALPLVKVDGRPALQLDVMARRFYLFGAVFNAQDFWRVVFLALAAAIGLVFVTALLGRVWCGWGCPQTVFLEGVYRPLERLIEGPREKRLRLAQAPWSVGKVAKRVALHVGYLAISLGLAHVALALFVSLPSMFEMVRGSPRTHWEAFLWTSGVTIALYGNFAWFREQMCVAICPYGRLQSVLLDRDSLIVGYDKARGEPRGKVRKDADNTKLGDCVDCNRCVTVCPTGIDIRNGTQMECIACAQCIDACDDVMTRLGREKGLIRYDSERGLASGVRRILRPRLALYGVLAVVAAGLLVVSMAHRLPFEANLVRPRGLPFVRADGVVRNQLELHLVSKSPDVQALSIQVVVPPGASTTMPTPTVQLAASADYRLPIFVSVPEQEFSGTFDVTVTVSDASGETRTVAAKFLGPAR